MRFMPSSDRYKTPATYGRGSKVDREQWEGLCVVSSMYVCMCQHDMRVPGGRICM